MSEIIVRYMPLPPFVRGQVLMDEDGNYNIYIDPRLPWDVQERVLAHELSHVERGDFHGDESVIDLEGFSPLDSDDQFEEDKD